MSLLSTLFQDPLYFVLMVAVFLLALSVHEAAHALMGYWLGDETAKRANRLTLNPFAHIDPLGFIALLTMGFGWGKPVPFNPYNLKYQRWGATLVAAAGPASNLLLGTVCALLFRFLLPTLGESNALITFLLYGGYLNFALMFFNLIPIPPLDGSKALFALLDAPRFERIRFFLQSQGSFLLIALILLDSFGGVHVFSWLSMAASGLFGFVAG